MAAVEQQPGLTIAEFGGGGGGSVIVAGLAAGMPEAQITAIFPTGDSGSKTGELRELFGGPAVGDGRKILGALATNGAAELFQDSKEGQPFGRFGPDATADTVKGLNKRFLTVIEGSGLDTTFPATILDRTVELVGRLPRGLRGHTYTNLALTALRQETGSLGSALAEMGRWVGAPKNVTLVPVTEESHNLVMHDKAAGIVLVGEGEIDDYTPADLNNIDVWLEAGVMDNRRIDDPRQVAAYLERRQDTRPPRATDQAIGGVATSRVALFAPGSPITTHAQMLLVDGIAEGFKLQQQESGLVVAVANLTEEKPGMTIGVHLRSIENAVGRPVTHLVHNTDTAGLSEGTIPLRFDPEADGFDTEKATAIPAALVDAHVITPDANDPIAHLRSPGHHDAWKVVDVLQTEILANAPATLVGTVA